jgi:hypothetical protein
MCYCLLNRINFTVCEPSLCSLQLQLIKKGREMYNNYTTIWRWSKLVLKFSLITNYLRQKYVLWECFQVNRINSKLFPNAVFDSRVRFCYELACSPPAMLTSCKKNWGNSLAECRTRKAIWHSVYPVCIKMYNHQLMYDKEELSQLGQI